MFLPSGGIMTSLDLRLVFMTATAFAASGCGLYIGSDGEPADAADPGPPSAAEAESLADAIDPDARTLCWDDRCVGIIGGDGRCGTCGRSRFPSL